MILLLFSPSGTDRELQKAASLQPLLWFAWHTQQGPSPKMARQAEGALPVEPPPPLTPPSPGVSMWMCGCLPRVRDASVMDGWHGC